MKKKIALVTGGYSGEAVISYQSAENILNNIDKSLYDVYKIDISKSGWFYTDTDNIRQQVSKENFSIEVGGQKITFDVALMSIHGTPGEDGRLLGYFDMIGLKYTSCNAAVSALTFNKRHTVAVAGLAGIDVAKSILLYKGEPYNIADIEQLTFPVFVKPNNGGSSIGMSKVVNKDEVAIKKAIDRAFEEDTQVLIEEFIKGREFTIGIMRDQSGEVIALPMTEIILKAGRDHFDYEAKYNGETAEVTPASAPTEYREQIATTAKKIYKVLGCSGIVRIDFIYNEAVDRPFMLEVNTVPGQTKESLVPKQIAAQGWDLKSFYTQIIEAALH